MGRQLQHYLDGVIDAEIAALIEAHLEDCRRCGLEADTYRQIKAALAARRLPPPPDAVQRLREFGLRLSQGDRSP